MTMRTSLQSILIKYQVQAGYFFGVIVLRGTIDRDQS
jgi:hypothetical protein